MSNNSNVARPSAVIASSAYAMGALFLVCVGMRPQLSGLPPLLPQIQADLAISHAWGGLLISLSFAMMGFGALTASAALRYVGSGRGISLSIAVIALSGLARAAAPAALSVILVAIPLGLAIGLATALMPVVAKERFSQRPGIGTGIYVLGIGVGSGLSVATAAPLAQAMGGWRGTLGVFAVATVLLTLPWLGLPSGPRASRGAQTIRPRLPTTGSAWLPIGIFSLQSTLFLGLITWLPSAYIERGWTETDAGLLASALTVSSLLGGVAVSWMADRIGSTTFYLVVTSSAAVTASFGFVLFPLAAWPWALLAGSATGGLLVLSLKLPLELFEGADDVANLSGLMLAGGYWTGAVVPVLLGGLRDATGTFTASFTSVGLMSVALLIASVVLAVRRSSGPA